MGEKGAWAYPGTAQIFEYGEYPLFSREWVKLRTLNFVRTFIGSIGTKALSAKVAVGVLRDSRKFSGHPCIGRIIARSSLQRLSFLGGKTICPYLSALLLRGVDALPIAVPSICLSVLFVRVCVERKIAHTFQRIMESGTSQAAR